MFIALEWYRWATWTLLALAPVVAFVLIFMSAPYGRHVRAGWGPRVPGRLAWMVMESPAVVLFAIVYASGSNRLGPLPLLFLGMWMVHYVHRTFVFPFRLRSTHAMPVVIALASFTFQSVNGYANAAWISELGSYTGAWLSDPRLWLGVALFVVGEAINLHADTVLISLRRPGESGYKIPQGGMYRFVTSPNYLGEIIAWTGWALATWSSAGLAFAVFSVANLAPRAWTHHRWYRDKFGEDYPKDRKVLIPFVW